MKILSVDDSAIIRKIIRGVVDMLGFEFLEAGNGEEALELLNNGNENVDLILLDWNMPVKDGYETLQALKGSANLKHIPVMMLTTESERTNIIKAMQAGASHYATKPFTQEDLMTKIMECMGQG